ncbi:MAG: hypothetical protein ABIL76_06040 [candidate division WOR-3 bacterium]
MEDQIYQQLIQYGGGTAIIMALIFLVREISRLIQVHKNGENVRKIDNLEKAIYNDLRHELDALWTEFREFREETKNNFQKLDERIRNIEFECRNIKKARF